MINFADENFAIYYPDIDSVLKYGMVMEEEGDMGGIGYVRAEWVEEYDRAFNFSLLDWELILRRIREATTQLLDATDLYQQMALFFYSLDHSTFMAVPIMAEGLIFVEAERLDILL